MDKTESRIQSEIIQFFKNNYCLDFHNPKCEIFSIPNESKSKQETLQKISIGMLPGASDLIVLVPNKILFIEVKTEIGRQSPTQVKFQKTVQKLGFDYYLVRNLDQFKKIVLPLI